MRPWNGCRTSLGSTRSLGVQLWTYLLAVMHGDFGMSFAFRIPVLRLIVRTAAGDTAADRHGCHGSHVLLALPLAFIAALRVNRWYARSDPRGIFRLACLRRYSTVGLVLFDCIRRLAALVPSAVTAMRGGERLYNLFSAGAGSRPQPRRCDHAQPARGHSTGAAGRVRRFAVAKGIALRVVMLRHVLRNALIATVTLIGLNIGTLLGGAVINESVFAVPGVGRLMVDSIFARDYPVIQGLTLVAGRARLGGFAGHRPAADGLDPRVGR